MKKSSELFLVAVALLLIFLSVMVIISFKPKQFSYEFETANVLFVSNDAHPGELLQKIKDRDSFVVASEFLPTGTTSFMTQPLTLFNSVFVAQDKFVVTVAKTVSSDGVLVSCDTNDGNRLSNRPMSAQECTDLLAKSDFTVFLVKLPNSSLSKSRVFVSENSVVIEPTSFEEVSRVSFLVLKAMYADSEEIINLINNFLRVIKV